MLPKRVQVRLKMYSPFDVERIVAQGLVAKDAALKETTADGKGKVDLTDITYTAINGAAKTYLSVTMRESVQLEIPTVFTSLCISH